MEVTLYKKNCKWRSSSCQSLVVLTVVPLGGNVIFYVKYTIHGDSLIFLGKCFGSSVILLWRNIDFITLSDGLSRQQIMSYHDKGYFLNEILMIGSMGKLMISFYGYFCCSTLMIPIVMRSNSLWSLYLAYVLTLILFPLSFLICNYLRSSVMMLINWL